MQLTIYVFLFLDIFICEIFLRGRFGGRGMTVNINIISSDMTPHNSVVMSVCIGGTYNILLQGVDFSALKIVAGSPVKPKYRLPNMGSQFVNPVHLYKSVNVLMQCANMPLVMCLRFC